MPVEFLADVRQTGHALNRARVLTAAYSPLNPRFFAPDFLGEKALKSLSEEEYNRRMVPSKEVRKNLLFAGAENVSQLRGFVEDRITLLAGQFASETEAGFDPQSAFACLNIVSNAMEKMSERRTGEEASAYLPDYFRGFGYC